MLIPYDLVAVAILLAYLLGALTAILGKRD
jgi:hypothetical protein